MKLTKEQWDAAPENAEWFAVEADGNGFFHVIKPEFTEGYGWVSDTHSYCYFDFDPTDWRNSLQQRPKETVSVDPEILKALNRKIAELEAELEQYKPKPKVTDGLVAIKGFGLCNPYIDIDSTTEYAGYAVVLSGAFNWEIIERLNSNPVLVCKEKS